MSHLAKNLDYLLHKNRLSANQLQELSGITQSTTTRIIAGKTTNPRQGVIKKYASYFGISEQDLVYTELEKQTNYLSNQSNAQFLDKVIDVWCDGDKAPNDMIPISYLRGIVGSMGNGYINDEPQKELKLWFRKETIEECNVNPKYAKAIVVAGESMLPELTAGQVIAIDTSATRIFDGEIYAFLRGDELKVKYLFKHGDGFKAVSRNDDKLRFPDEIYSAQDIENENIKILGQFWWKSETRKIRR